MTAVNLEISPPFIRTSAKAIIIRDGCVLSIRHDSRDGDWFTLPGGGQQLGEPLTLTLQRECLEELGVGVSVGLLRFIREYIGANHEFRWKHTGFHKVDFMFECSLLGEPGSIPPTNPDQRQTGIEWLPLKTLLATDLYPKDLCPHLVDGIQSGAPVYLGDIN